MANSAHGQRDVIRSVTLGFKVLLIARHNDRTISICLALKVNLQRLALGCLVGVDQAGINRPFQLCQV